MPRGPKGELRAPQSGLHRNLDGRRIVNYIQWQSRDLLQSAHLEFRKEWDPFDQLTDEIDPHLYEVSPRHGR